MLGGNTGFNLLQLSVRAASSWSTSCRLLLSGVATATSLFVFRAALHTTLAFVRALENKTRETLERGLHDN